MLRVKLSARTRTCAPHCGSRCHQLRVLFNSFFYRLRMCLQDVIKTATARGFWEHYDWVVRSRPDAVFYQPVPSLARLMPDAVYARAFRIHGPSFDYSLPMHSLHTRRDRVVSLTTCRLHGAAIQRASPLGPGRALTLSCGWNNAGSLP